MTVTRLAQLEGIWRLQRRIQDRHLDRVGQLTGQAQIVEDGVIWRYTEQGMLQWPEGPALQASRTYLFVQTPNGVEVRFEDGTAFHEFSWNTASAMHFCAPDTYKVAYSFTQRPDWTSTWTVTGPRKKYRMESHYSRP